MFVTLLTLSLIQFHPPKPIQTVLALPQKSPVVARSATPPKPDTIIRPQSSVSTSRQITVQNKITKDMLGYRFLGTHYPDIFQLFINGKEVKSGNKELCSIQNNKITIRYSYQFGSHRNGAKEVIFNLDPTKSDFTVSFDWRDEYRILINNATPVSVQRIAK